MFLIQDALCDYTIIRKPPFRYRQAREILLPGLRDLWRAFGLNRPRVVSVALENCAASYVNGSCLDPIIMIDPNIHLEAAGEDWEVLKKSIKSSMVHELIHAYLDSNGLDCEFHEEPFVEGMTLKYIDEGYSEEKIKKQLDEYLIK